MNHTHTESNEPRDDTTRGEQGGEVDIRVNTKPVKVEERILTGLQIKEAAIRAGVNIKIDFVLFEDMSNGKQIPVPDEKQVEIHKGQCFDAIDNDDHS
jgi:hypothetical protein